ncbi:MAG: di-trans,poly-cis-decaprenylcistransferase [Alphaproteobacteria bacterium]|nr:di-trans,poly-cis-decaprenylcistransferase [Alphaproteobacteria bacterium]
MVISQQDTGSKIPRHVAIIMDGNGRWAKRRGLPRTAGHKQGAEAARKIVEAAADRGVAYLTLFGFSSENWNRPRAEIEELMKLLRYYLRSETADLHKRNARLRVVGDLAAFDADIIQLIDNAQALTENNTRINVTIALNYGGRQDIAQAVETLCKEVLEAGIVPPQEAIARALERNLRTHALPDPDLLIRTSGEKRISNFMLWQCAYAEMVFSPVLWPDFGPAELDQALGEYADRDRRFGAVKQS